jgi:hypothetical protein
MNPPHLSTTVVGIVLVVVALGFYGLIVLYGAWIDGKRQRIRKKGQHPVTEGTGEVHAREDEERSRGGAMRE